MWKTYLSQIEIEGTKVVGTHRGLRTAWWNAFFLRLFWWRTVIVFKIHTETAQQGYRLGFRTDDGLTMILSEICGNDQFRMMVGYEDVVFFALDTNEMREIPLEVVIITTKSDHRFKHARLR